MGRRRTAWVRRRARTRVHARVGAALLCGVTALSLVPALWAWPARAAGRSDDHPFAYAEDARLLPAASSTTDAERLELGGIYRSSLSHGTKAYYRLELDSAANAYVSATVVPPPGTTVSALDGVKVSVQDVDGGICSVDTETFGSVRSARPLTAWGMRELTSRRSRCQEAGTYYVVVETGRGGASGGSGASDDSAAPDAFASGEWGLELTTVSEPGLSRTGATEAPESWNSAPPADLTGDPVARTGGAGFSRATRLGHGVWQDGIRPGQTLYYEVPLGWGQQVYVTAELGSSPGRSGATAGALDLTLYNPARGPIEDTSTGYYGRQQSADLDPLPPVGHENRFAVADRVSGMRFAGSYYLAVHLSAQVAERFGDGPLGLTLRLRVSGAARSGPGYAGEPLPRGIFDVAGGPASLPGGGPGAGASGGGAQDEAVMRALAVGGIGGGSALVAGLGVWTAVARRRARAG
ncbi:hypothetical protein ACIQ6Y_13645 [Streptomyces sp. NPDC096205]|uniref:hypothetical protein n=1 Tax=Streptomyces sp. NPDC096205 TaxID=3366081 RepID=UPI0038034BEF